MPSWSTARHSQCFLPAILMATSSRCHLSPAQGSRRRIWLANAWPNLQRPLPHGLVADDDAARGQHLLDHAQAEREAEIQPDRVADDLGREAVAGIAGANGRRHPLRLPALLPIRKPASAKLTVPRCRGRHPHIYSKAGTRRRSGGGTSRRRHRLRAERPYEIKQMLANCCILDPEIGLDEFDRLALAQRVGFEGVGRKLHKAPPVPARVLGLYRRKRTTPARSATGSARAAGSPRSGSRRVHTSAPAGRSIRSPRQAFAG